MSVLAESLQGLVGIAVVAIGSSVVLGRLRLAVHLPPPATGDPSLSGLVDLGVERSARRVAAIVVDRQATPISRLAFINADEHTSFEIGSVSKILTGLLIADAVDRGEVSMDSRLEDVDAGYAGTEVGQTTVEELCTHHSGLPNLPRSPRMFASVLVSNWFGTDPYRSSTATNVARAAGRQRLRGRGRYRYSNLGAAVVGNSVAHALGVDYPAALEARILGPLGMADTGADRSGRPRLPRLPRGWRKHGRRSWPWTMPGYAPAGAVVSTAADIARLAQALLADGAPGHRSMSALPGRLAGRPNTGQGLFWLVSTDPGTGRRAVWHNGQTGGYSAYLALYPDAGRAVAVLSDVADAAAQERLAQQLIRTWAP